MTKLKMETEKEKGRERRLSDSPFGGRPDEEEEEEEEEVDGGKVPPEYLLFTIRVCSPESSWFSSSSDSRT